MPNLIESIKEKYNTKQERINAFLNMYNADLSYIQNSPNNIIANTDIMSITDLMTVQERMEHLIRYTKLHLETAESDNKALNILNTYK